MWKHISINKHSLVPSVPTEKINVRELVSAFLTKWANMESQRLTGNPPMPTASAPAQADASSVVKESMLDARAASPAAETEQGPDPAVLGITWAEWKATMLNRLFQEQGVTGQPGRITAETVRHGERRTEKEEKG